MKLLEKDELEQTIKRTRDLLEHLENDEIEDAQEVIESLAGSSSTSGSAAIKKGGEDDLFIEIGKLTRNLHEALNTFNLDPRITNIAASEIPDAKDRLNYVIERTEAAANKTMDKVDHCNQLANVIAHDSQELLLEWQKLYRRELEPGDFRKLCKKIETHLKKNKDTADELNSGLSDVLLAQDYQDLTGQVIRQVITLVHDVEESMVNVIRMFGNMDGYAAAKNKVNIKTEAEGPIVNTAMRDDIVKGQDEVDDLLSSLGF